MVEDIAAKTGSRKNPEISATMVGDTGYLFSPNHLDRPAHLSIVPGLTEKELNDLKKLYENLGLSKNGRNIIAGDYDKSYDKFYVCRYNKQIAVFWFANTTLHASFMGPDGELNKTPVILLKTRDLKCGSNDAPYQEMVYNINSLQFDKIGNNLLVVYNASIKEKPGCINQKSQIYAQLLGTDLKPVAEKFDIVDPVKSSESDFATYIAASGTNAYIFAQSRNASNTIYGTALNAKFEVTDTFYFGQDIEAGNNHKPLTLLKGRSGKMYCLYSQELLGEVVLAMRQTGPGGYFSKPIYLYHSEGTLTDYNGYFANDKFILYLIERSFQKDRLKKVTIQSGLLKFEKEKQ
ncbi:MAG: hypothetical protein HC830_12435 [Bacteroidetes bacterium]|nr:hypothetical protein [Bacteroidota bacterium]